MTCLDQRPGFQLKDMPKVLKEFNTYFSWSSDSKDFQQVEYER